MAQIWLLLLAVSFSVLQLGHSHGKVGISQLEKLWDEVNALKRASSHFLACVRGIRHNRKCFMVSEESKCYRDAKEDCISQGGTLAIPQDISENDALSDYGKCTAPGCQSFWLGIADGTQEGTYVDMNGHPITFFNWMRGQGGYRKGRHQDCVALSLAARGKWRDDACSDKKRYFCEFLISQCSSRLP